MRICSNCNKEVLHKTKLKSKRVFCDQKCYSDFQRNKLPIEEHGNWKGGITPYEAHRRWVKKNPERMAHLKARRYARERNAKGSHSFKEWQELCKKFSNKCANCKQEKKLTKDHMKPLSLGGTDFIKNIQPLCRNCNSRKWKKNIYQNPELLSESK